MGIADFFNLCEAALWIAMGLSFLIALMWLSIRSKPDRRTLPLALILIAFGISDIVEFRTGAWWRPWWLFVWKAVCVMTLVALAGSYYRQQQRTRD